MSENVLTIENATMQFGGVVAVDNLNLKVHRRVCAHQRRGVVRGTQDH